MEATPDLENVATEAEQEHESVRDPSTVTRRRLEGKIKFESVMQRSEAVAYFAALVDGLRHGQLQFRQGDEDLALAPSEQVVVEVKASRKGGKERVAFELEWKRAEADARELHG
jgi:amphi-Trp domain-containing protein